jgi:Fe-S cluster assembly protein SufD
MTQIATGADSYAAQFAASAQAAALPNALASLRDDAFHCFDRLGFPTTRIEEWRFSNVTSIAETPFVAPVTAPSYGQAALDALPLPRLSGPELVFVNGWFMPALSTTDGLPAEVKARSLAEVLASDPETVIPHLGQLARIENHAFTALNTAFLRDGAVIEIGKGVVVEAPIHLLFITTSGDGLVLSQPRVLVLADANSQVRVLESHAGEGDTPYLNNPLTEVVVADGAVVDHYAIVREAEAGFRIGGLFARLGRASNFSSHAITLSGAIVRHEANVVLDGEGGVCTLNGLYLGNGGQLVDNQTTIDHAQPHCDSHELYKGILSGRSRAVFNGKIIVRLDAQKTDAKQSNKALLLSEDAQITTKPQLEIFADDVKCTHGATIGQLDAESLFYLRSRALSEAQARQLLIHAFAADLLSHIKIDVVRRELDTLLTQRLPVGAGG